MLNSLRSVRSVYTLTVAIIVYAVRVKFAEVLMVAQLNAVLLKMLINVAFNTACYRVYDI